MLLVRMLTDIFIVVATVVLGCVDFFVYRHLLVPPLVCDCCSILACSRVLDLYTLGMSLSGLS